MARRPDATPAADAPRTSGTLIGLWCWWGGLAALFGGLPLFASREAAQAAAMLDVPMPALAALAFKVGSCAAGPVGMITAAVTAVVTGLPAMVTRSPRLTPPYVLGGIVAVLMLAVLAFAAQNVVAEMQRALLATEVPELPDPAAPWGR